MKLEVGMYVRTIYGKITKVINTQEVTYGTGIEIYWTDDKQYPNDCLFDIWMIQKSSHNLIDLIEVGDYVNGYKVVEIVELPQKIIITTLLICSTEPKHIDIMNKKDYAETWIDNNDIKEVLTHEMYNANCYKVGE